MNSITQQRTLLKSTTHGCFPTTACTRHILLKGTTPGRKPHYIEQFPYHNLYNYKVQPN